MFANISLPASDEIIDLMARSSKDERPFKVDLTVGVYKDTNDNVVSVSYTHLTLPTSDLV